MTQNELGGIFFLAAVAGIWVLARFANRHSDRINHSSLGVALRESGASQHAIDRFFGGHRIHPGTRKKLTQAVEILERRGQ